MYKFEKLSVWQKSLEMITTAYELSKNLPRSESRILIDQLLRAPTSVSLNIAEGSGSAGDREFRRYLLLSRKSLCEVVSITKIIERVYGVETRKLQDQAAEVSKMLSGLLSKLKANS